MATKIRICYEKDAAYPMHFEQKHNLISVL